MAVKPISVVRQQAVTIRNEVNASANTATRVGGELVDMIDTLSTLANGNSPYIGDNGNWWEWNDETASYVDTGIPADSSIAAEEARQAAVAANEAAIAANEAAATIDDKIAGKADIDSPTFTGTPQAPTPGNDSNDTSVATTAFVKANAGGGSVWDYIVDSLDKFKTIPSDAKTVFVKINRNDDDGAWDITSVLDSQGRWLIPDSVQVIEGETREYQGYEAGRVTVKISYTVSAVRPTGTNRVIQSNASLMMRNLDVLITDTDNPNPVSILNPVYVHKIEGCNMTLRVDGSSSTAQIHSLLSPASTDGYGHERFYAKDSLFRLYSTRTATVKSCVIYVSQGEELAGYGLSLNFDNCNIQAQTNFSALVSCLGIYGRTGPDEDAQDVTFNFKNSVLYASGANASMGDLKCAWFTMDGFTLQMTGTGGLSLAGSSIRPSYISNGFCTASSDGVTFISGAYNPQLRISNISASVGSIANLLNVTGCAVGGGVDSGGYVNCYSGSVVSTTYLAAPTLNGGWNQAYPWYEGGDNPDPDPDPDTGEEETVDE